MTNQNPEQIARDKIDNMLILAGWVVQSKNKVNLAANKGVAVREYQTDGGIADYALFVDKKPVGIIEAKREEAGEQLTTHEEQSKYYAVSKLKYLNNDPLPFVYESTGALTRFTDYRDPKPRSRPVFHFHRPETLAEWFAQPETLRSRLNKIPELDPAGLRPAQIKAIANLEASFKANRPRALIQMATGAGKTFTACTFVYRLLKFARAKRILFLVDTKNLGEQAEQEFLKYQPTDDNRKFTELYNVQRLSSSYIASDSQVCISTIQRLYSILQGKELEESAEETNPNESVWQKKEPLPVSYSIKNFIEQFDFIIIDECHRSIYNVWQQVLEYYDAFLIGLTATPDKRTFGFFNQNVVSEYTYEESISDGVNVPYNVYTIETEITKNGAKLKAEQYIDKREKLSRKKRWERLDEDYEYKPSKLDKDVVNPNQIRLIIQEFKRALKADIFPDRIDEHGEYEVPKTLIFAKTDSHAEDIIAIVREEFGEGNEFCKKVTYIDTINQDWILKSEFDAFSTAKAESVVQDFAAYIEANKDEITALSLFYCQPYQRRELTFKMIKEVLEKLKLDKPMLAPVYVWEAYAQLEGIRVDSPKNELVALVSLIRRVTGFDQGLTAYDKTVDKNFQTWVFGKQAGALKFTEEQMSWLRMLKDHVVMSFHVELDDLDYTPFDREGGRGRMYQLFGDEMGVIMEELNEALAA
jgi:type I restriction enzyme R subunit